MHKLTQAILTFDGRRAADAVDALTQWVLKNKYRLKTPEEVHAYKPQAVQRKPTQTSGLTAAFRAELERVLNPDPTGSERDREVEYFARRVA
jgi:hypothetical protein